MLRFRVGGRLRRGESGERGDDADPVGEESTEQGRSVPVEKECRWRVAMCGAVFGQRPQHRAGLRGVRQVPV